MSSNTHKSLKSTRKAMTGRKGGTSAMATGAAGAAIGAAIGGIAGAALADEGNRKKLGELAEEAKKFADDALEANQVEVPSEIEIPTKNATAKSSKSKN